MVSAAARQPSPTRQARSGVASVGLRFRHRETRHHVGCCISATAGATDCKLSVCIDCTHPPKAGRLRVGTSGCPEVAPMGPGEGPALQASTPLSWEGGWRSVAASEDISRSPARLTTGQWPSDRLPATRRWPLRTSARWPCHTVEWTQDDDSVRSSLASSKSSPPPGSRGRPKPRSQHQGRPASRAGGPQTHPHVPCFLAAPGDRLVGSSQVDKTVRTELCRCL